MGLNTFCERPLQDTLRRCAARPKRSMDFGESLVGTSNFRGCAILRNGYGATAAGDFVGGAVQEAVSMILRALPDPQDAFNPATAYLG